MIDRLNYNGFAQIAWETYYSKLPKKVRVTWETLPEAEKQAWVRVVQVVTGTVAAADLV